MPSILIFDSGIGGLSVLSHIRQKLPSATINYVADHAAYPYGDKQEQWLIKRIDHLFAKMVEDLKPDLAVIACNTASTLILPTLRAHVTIPIVGVVPAIKTAAKLSKTKHIGLLATPGTVARQYMDDLINDFADDCKVDRLGTTELVHLAEEKLSAKPVCLDTLENATRDLLSKGMDTVVLGCTHFPLLLDELTALYPTIQFVDSGEAIARRTESLLKPSASSNTNDDNPMGYYSTSAISTAQINQLKGFGFTQFNELNFGISSSA